MTSADQAAVPQGAGQAPGRHRPWGWISICVLLVLVAGGLAIWALSLQSDLDDQRAETAKANEQAQQANEQVSALSDQVDAISQKISDASDQLSQAGADVQQNAQQALEGLNADVGSLKDQVANAIEQAAAEQP
jgi:peptidoglycan hydrolase CwlO-like protein